MKNKLFTKFSLLTMVCILAGCAMKNSHEFNTKPESITKETPIKHLTIQQISFVSSTLLSDKDLDNLKKDITDKGIEPTLKSLGYDYKENTAKFDNIKTNETILYSSVKNVPYIEKIDKVKGKVVSVDTNTKQAGVFTEIFTTYMTDGSIRLAFNFTSREIIEIEKNSNGLELPVMSEKNTTSTVKINDRKGRIVSSFDEPVTINGKPCSRVDFIYIQIDN